MGAPLDLSPEHIVWLLFRKGMKDECDRIAASPTMWTAGEAAYRERVEKAGLVAVVNFTAKAYQQ